MDKLWKGRFNKQLDSMANDFNSSIAIDSRMYAEDIEGSIAHATMLNKCGIISIEDKNKLVAELNNIKNEIASGALMIDMTAEDIHSFIEGELTCRLKDTGKKLHTARSRNDQVALDVRMHLSRETDSIINLLKKLIATLTSISECNLDTIMPGYTHLQRAQPITFAHHLMAYSAMFMRDVERLSECLTRIKVSPLGSCALAGTTFNIDRDMVKDIVGFNSVAINSLDGVSDRDFSLELASDIAIIMTHLSRFSEEIILWCSSEFSFIELDDAYSTGSSIMPQKKNPDIAELIRGKSGRTYGNLITLLTMLKGLPLAYNKDMQEDKEAIFDSVDTVNMCISVLIPMLETMTVNKSNMLKAAAKGFINATDCADYLAKSGLPFREAYKIVGEIVAYCIANNLTLESMTMEQYKSFSDKFNEDIYSEILMSNCVEKRNSYGGPSNKAVQLQIKLVKDFLGKTDD